MQGRFWGLETGLLGLRRHAREDLPCDPHRYLRDDRISRGVNLASVGRIQPEGNPIGARDSPPVNHRTPSVRLSNENLATQTDEASQPSRQGQGHARQVSPPDPPATRHAPAAAEGSSSGAVCEYAPHSSCPLFLKLSQPFLKLLATSRQTSRTFPILN